MKKIKTLLCIFLVLTLSGCWSSKELDELAIIMGIGIELAPSGSLECTTQIIVPENVGTSNDGSSGSSDQYLNFRTDGDYLSKCISDVSNESGKKIYMSHDLIILLGRQASCSGIYRYLDYFMRDNQLRSDVSILVTDDNILKVLDTKTELMKIPATNLALISTGLTETSTGKNISVRDFIENMMKKKKGSLVPIASLEEKSGKPEIILGRNAVFTEDRMVGELSTIETRGVLWLTDEIGSGDIPLHFGDGIISLKINHSKTDLRLKHDDSGAIYFEADIKADMYMLRDDSNVVERIGIDAVKAELDNRVKNEIAASLSVMQEMGIDVYGFGDMIYKKEPHLWEQLEENWEETFRNLYVDVRVDCGIRESGSIIGSVKGPQTNSGFDGS